jgi:GT2 family glycosyltransferase
MKINAIIVNYFTADFLPPLLEILQSEGDISKIVISNNGDRVNLNDLTSQYPKATVIHNPENIGFAAAVNEACLNDFADYYLLLNPDTLPDQGFSKALLAVAIESDALLTGPRFFWDKEKTFRLPPAPGFSWSVGAGLRLAVQSSAEAVLTANNWVFRHERFWEKTDPFSETFLSGACVLIKNDNDFFKSGKILDERFFLYFEDTDLCLQALLANKPVMVTPDAEVVHYWDKSPGDKKSIFMEESEKLFLEKYYGKSATYPEFLITENKDRIPVFELGELVNAPEFQIDEKHDSESFYFEFGINRIFTPFAQAIVHSGTFVFPQNIWEGLKPGVYFFRQRTFANQVLAIWKWRKV